MWSIIGEIKKQWIGVQKKLWAKKSVADNRYNEGTTIGDSSNPVWKLIDNRKTIEGGHVPCGYWNNVTKFVYWVFTSRPYPVIIGDSFGVVGDFIGASLKHVLHIYNIPEESFEVQGDFVEAVVKHILHTYNCPEESFEVEGDFIGATLKHVLHNYNCPEESFEVSGDFIGASRKTVLIVYNNWPEESFEVSGDFIGATKS